MTQSLIAPTAPLTAQSVAIPKYLALTGRVSDWLENPQGRKPVSCTVFTVDDSMEGPDGIEASWLKFSKALREGAGVAIDLSRLRPSGDDNGKGLVASGAPSFARVYSVLCETLRKGGLYRSGATTIYMDSRQADAGEFLTLSRHRLPWAKRALYVGPELIGSEMEGPVLEALKRGDIFLAKRVTKRGKRLYSNVCMEILLESGGTCLLSHVNLGQTPIGSIRKALVEGANYLMDIHPMTGLETTGVYLSHEEDRQVGLGVLGLANLLAREKVRYESLVEALEMVEELNPSQIMAVSIPELLQASGSFPAQSPEAYTLKAQSIAFSLYQGYIEASLAGIERGFERVFTVAPTATMSFKHRDSEGYTTCPEISPPLGATVQRSSDLWGVQTFDYPPEVETAAQVGFDTYFRLAQAWQKMMNVMGLGHSISFNLWSSYPIDRAFLKRWMDSPLVTTYYLFQVEQGYLDKSRTGALTGESHILTESPEPAPTLAIPDSPQSSHYSPDLSEGPGKACGLRGASEDEGYCESCGG